MWVEGAQATVSLDVVQAASGPFIAYIVPVQTTVSDGFVTIQFIGEINKPSIKAIEVIKLLSVPISVAPSIPPRCQT